MTRNEDNLANSLKNDIESTISLLESIVRNGKKTLLSFPTEISF